MPCNFPVTVYHTPGGGISFKKAGTAGVPIQIPCNRCMGCRIQKVRMWSARMIHESRLYSDNSFITLSYSDAALPPGQTLVKRDVQLFVKRLRKALEPKKIRFFLCGEYGERTFRPHYHGIFFNYWPADAKREGSRDGHAFFSSESLARHWGLGFVDIGNVNADTCQYTAGYITKKITGPRASEHYQRIDAISGELISVEPEFALMSRRPGIGRGWIENNLGDIYPADHTVLNGVPAKTPAYYDKVLKAKDPELHDKVTYRRLLGARKRAADNTPERRETKETCLVLKSQAVRKAAL